MKFSRYNLLVFAAFSFALLSGCKGDSEIKSESGKYELSIDGEPIKLAGYDYVNTSNEIPTNDSEKVKVLPFGKHDLKLLKPENDKSPTVLVSDGETLYKGDKNSFQIDIQVSGVREYTLKTAYIKPLKFYIKGEVEPEISLSGTENSTAATQSENKSEKEKELDEPKTEINIEHEKVLDDQSKQPNLVKEEIINLQYKDDPNYELVEVDGTKMYVRKRADDLTKEEPGEKKDPVIIDKAKEKIPTRLRKFGSITNQNCETSNLETRNGPFNFTIIPKTFLNLKNINVYGGSNWSAIISITSFSGDLNKTVQNETVVNSKCELNLSNIETILIPNAEYQITIKSSSDNALLFNLTNCNGYIKSNEHMTIKGDGAKFISKIFYKY